MEDVKLEKDNEVLNTEPTEQAKEEKVEETY